MGPLYCLAGQLQILLVGLASESSSCATEKGRSLDSYSSMASSATWGKARSVRSRLCTGLLLCYDYTYNLKRFKAPMAPGATDSMTLCMPPAFHCWPCTYVFSHSVFLLIGFHVHVATHAQVRIIKTDKGVSVFGGQLRIAPTPYWS